MNRQRVRDGMSAEAGKKSGLVLLTAVLIAGLPGCGEKTPVNESVKAAPVEKPVTEAELTERLQKEIDATEEAIAEAVQLQDKLSNEIEVLQQLLEETETGLITREEEVSRLEAQQGR